MYNLTWSIFLLIIIWWIIYSAWRTRRVDHDTVVQCKWTGLASRKWQAIGKRMGNKVTQNLYLTPWNICLYISGSFNIPHLIFVVIITQSCTHYLCLLAFSEGLFIAVHHYLVVSDVWRCVEWGGSQAELTGPLADPAHDVGWGLAEPVLFVQGAHVRLVLVIRTGYTLDSACNRAEPLDIDHLAISSKQPALRILVSASWTSHLIGSTRGSLIIPTATVLCDVAVNFWRVSPA